MRGKWLIGLVSVFFITACGNDNAEQGNKPNQDNQFQPIHYETPDDDKQERMGDKEKTIGEKGGYPQSDQKEVNRGDDNTNGANESPYSNEKTRLISKYLAERKEIVQAQVSETDDRIIVAVITKDQNKNLNLTPLIEKEVRQVEPDKEIVVYTDNIYWHRMRNLNSHPSTITREMQEKLDDFFGRD